MVDVHWVGEDEWELVREVRLRALAENPEAFGSTHAREAAFHEQDWRARFGNSETFLAFDGDRPVGIICGLYGQYPGDEGRYIVAMWLAPEHRGTSVAAALVEAVRAWAERDRASALRLWNADDNERSRRFYERMGFVATGERQPLRAGSDTDQEEMSRPVRDPSSEPTPVDP
jgi:RimJ/RimL family protein N-acetyltransferase